MQIAVNSGSDQPMVQVKALHWGLFMVISTIFGGAMLYRVTNSRNKDSILSKGILPMQPGDGLVAFDGGSDGSEYIFAFSNFSNAVKWAVRMDWEFYMGMVSIEPDSSKWDADDCSRSYRKFSEGEWKKKRGCVPAPLIYAVVAVDVGLIKAILKLGSVDDVVLLAES